jgi:(2Fe-2S) ferredoxin
MYTVKPVHVYPSGAWGRNGKFTLARIVVRDALADGTLKVQLVSAHDFGNTPSSFLIHALDVVELAAALIK